MTVSKGLAGKVLSGRVYPEVFPLADTDRVVNVGCGGGPQAVVYKGRYSRMVGLDINLGRLQGSRADLKAYGLGREYHTVCADVERVPLTDGTFDKALAIDIIEHVQHPETLCAETFRLLRPGGLLLITFPLQHDRFKTAVSALARVLLRRVKRPVSTAWDPDAHNSAHGFAKWTAIIESAGFTLVRWRASTLFPPLHLYGVPRFWFSSDTIHRIDAALCRVSGVRRLGQTAVVVYARP